MRNIRLTNVLRHLMYFGALVTLSGCPYNSPPPSEREPRQVQQHATATPTPAPPPVCDIALVPEGGPVIVPSPPLRVAANTTAGCSVTSVPPPIVVPPGAFNPGCIQTPGTAANSIVVNCGGVPASAQPPKSGLGLTFKCTCPPGSGIGEKTVFASYLF